MTSTGNDRLSTTQLKGIAPDPRQVNETSLAMLRENAKWWMANNGYQDWVADLLGEAVPATVSQDPTRQARIQLDGAFYRDFSMSMMGSAFGSLPAQDGGPSSANQLDRDQTAKLKFYLTRTIAKSKGFNRQSADTFLQAYVLATPELHPYLEDDSNDWAQLLCDDLTQPEENREVMNLVLAKDRSLLDRYSNLLAALEPSGRLAVQYHEGILMQCLLGVTQNAAHSTKRQIMQWLPDFLQGFARQYGTSAARTGREAPSETGDAAPFQNGDYRAQTADDLKEAFDHFGTWVELADAIADFLVAARGISIFDRSRDAAERWAAKYPKLVKVAKVFLVVFWAGGFYDAIMAYKDWSNLTETQKGGLISSTVQLAASMISAVPEALEFLQAGRSGAIRLFRGVRACFGDRGVYQPLVRDLRQIDADWFAEGGNLADAVRGEETLWRKLFGRVETFMDWFAPAVAAAMAVIATIQFVTDLEQSAPAVQEAFDGVIAAAALGEAVFTFAALAPGLEVLGPVGAFFAVVGLVAALVDAFVPKPKPEAPVDAMMRDHVRPFVDGLQEPPASWRVPKAA